jgi:two-component sensor histidine kinase
MEITLRPLTANTPHARDIDKPVEDASFHFFFDTLPVPCLACDFSSVRRYFERLSSSGLDVAGFFRENPEDVAACLGLTSLVAINSSALPFFAGKLGAEGRWRLKFLSSEALDFLLLSVLLGLWEGKTEFPYEDLILSSGPEAHYGKIHLGCPPDARESWSLVFISILDRSEARRLETQLRGIAEEKTLLLRELQHRVKNNLAIIDSFISLERLSCADERVREALLPVSARIQSMANAYDLLSGGEGLRRLEVGGYLRSVVANVCDLSELSAGPIVSKVSCGDISLDIDTTMRLGLVVDELALNSMKYAFPGGEWPETWAPRISLSLIADPAATVGAAGVAGRDVSFLLVYSDNGLGLPEGFDYAGGGELWLKKGAGAGGGLGHLLVGALLDQLGATIEVRPLAQDRPRGLLFEIRFSRA